MYLLKSTGSHKQASNQHEHGVNLPADGRSLLHRFLLSSPCYSAPLTAACSLVWGGGGGAESDQGKEGSPKIRTGDTWKERSWSSEAACILHNPFLHPHTPAGPPPLLLSVSTRAHTCGCPGLQHLHPYSSSAPSA